MRKLVVLLVLAMPLFAQQEAAPGIHLIRGRFTPGTQPDGNTVILRAPDGLIVVDTGRHAAHTESIIAFAKSANVPVKVVINTHWHLDHIGGNPAIRRAFPAARIYASDALGGAMSGFLANYKKQLEEMLAQQENEAFRKELAIINSGNALAPDEVIKSSAAMTIAGRPLRVELEKDSVTAGDVWLFDAASGVVIAGDLVTLPVPFLDTACATRWKESLDRIAKTDFELLIPGHGPPLTRRQFDVYRTAYERLLACKDKCVDAWISDAAPLIPGEDREFTRTVMDYYTGVLAHQRQECAPGASAASTSSAARTP